MTLRRQKHLDESWVVKINRERDQREQIISRARFEAFREVYIQRIREDQERDPGWF